MTFFCRYICLCTCINRPCIYLNFDRGLDTTYWSIQSKSLLPCEFHYALGSTPLQYIQQAQQAISSSAAASVTADSRYLASSTKYSNGSYLEPALEGVRSEDNRRRRRRSPWFIHRTLACFSIVDLAWRESSWSRASYKRLISRVRSREM